MPVTTLIDSMTMLHGSALKNRMLLAPLTNQQSNADGTANALDLAWIEQVSSGGHAIVMTCATNVQANGISFPGQLGIYDDRHLPGLAKIAAVAHSHDAMAAVQLHHGGVRSLGSSHGQPMGPSDDADSGARGMTTAEVENLRYDFIAGARRAQTAGFDGVEIHGAFGFVITQFLSTQFNRRTDRYGGSLENRARLLTEILHGIRRDAGENFQLGLRLSMERYRLSLTELRDVASALFSDQAIDYLDVAPRGFAKTSDEPEFRGQRIIDVFTELPRNGVRVGASGGIHDSEAAQHALDLGLDFVMLGRASIGQPNFPNQIIQIGSASVPTPITRAALVRNHYSDAFIDYLVTQRGFGA